MGKKGKKKGGNAPSKPAVVQEEDVFGVIECDDDGTLTREDCSVFAKLVMNHGKQLGKIANDFVEAFKNRCLLSIGYSMVMFHEVIANSDVDMEKSFVLPRIVVIYLLYKIRDIEPWLKRQKEKGKENLNGHPFIEFFFSLANSDESKPFPSSHIPVHDVEQKMTRLILARRGHELNSLNANELFDKFRNVHFNVPDPNCYKDLLAKFEKQAEVWPENMDTLVVPAIVFNLYLDGGNVEVYDDYEISAEEVNCIAEQLWLITMAKMPFDFSNKILPPVPVGPESWERHFMRQEGLAISDPNKPVGTKTVRPSAVETTVTEVHTEVEVDGESIPTVQLVEVEAPEVPEQEPGTSTSTQVRLSNIKPIIPKIFKEEKLTSSEVHELTEFMQNVPLDDEILKYFAKEMPPERLTRMVERHPRLATVFLSKMVAHDKDLMAVYLESLKELGVNLLCLEIILRAYRTIPDLSREILTEYVVFIVKRIDIETVSTQLRERNIRISCLFISNLFLEKIIQDITSPSLSNMLTEVNHFLVKYTQFKEAGKLYSQLTELRRRANME